MITGEVQNNKNDYLASVPVSIRFNNSPGRNLSEILMVNWPLDYKKGPLYCHKTGSVQFNFNI